jgi:hypothetical protein
MSTIGFHHLIQRLGKAARMPFSLHPHMLRHACGYKLANDGHDTRALQHYLGHKNIQHTVRYTELSPPAPLQDLPRYYGLLRPCAPRRYSRPRGWSRLRLLPSRFRRDRAQVLTFRTKAWSSFAPPTCRMPLGQSQVSPELIPEEGSSPGFGIA